MKTLRIGADKSEAVVNCLCGYVRTSTCILVCMLAVFYALVKVAW